MVRRTRFSAATSASLTVSASYSPRCTPSSSYVPTSAWPAIRLRSDARFAWLIDDTTDSNVAASVCAYDRIVAAGPALTARVRSGSPRVWRYDLALNISAELAATVSDHYPVELVIEPPPSAAPSAAPTATPSAAPTDEAIAVPTAAALSAASDAAVSPAALLAIAIVAVVILLLCIVAFIAASVALVCVVQRVAPTQRRSDTDAPESDSIAYTGSVVELKRLDALGVAGTRVSSRRAQL